MERLFSNNISTSNNIDVSASDSAAVSTDHDYHSNDNDDDDRHNDYRLEDDSPLPTTSNDGDDGRDGIMTSSSPSPTSEQSPGRRRRRRNRQRQQQQRRNLQSLRTRVVQSLPLRGTGTGRRNTSSRRRSSTVNESQDNNHCDDDDDNDDDNDQNDYRGFDTSIADMFSDPYQEEADFCSLVCCGCLLADRNRYLVTGIRPVSVSKRLFAHIFTPFVVFAMAVYAAVTVPDPLVNQTICYAFLVIFIVYFISQCFKGAWKRRLVRENLLWARFHQRDPVRAQQMDEHDGDGDMSYSEYSDGGDDASYQNNRDRRGLPEYYQGQTRADSYNAHMCLGCYAEDRGRRRPQEYPTFMARIFQCWSCLCCGQLCGMHLQICGICATAQEARQIESMTSPGKRRIDYITMQNQMEYYKAIYDSRHAVTPPTSSWYQRVSTLSWWLITVFALCVLLLFAISMYPKLRFTTSSFIVFILTVSQSWIIAVFVWWRSRKNVSVDYLIKLFGSGFCISTSLALFYEVLFGTVIKAVMAVGLAVSGIDEVEANGYQSTPLQFIGVQWALGQQVNNGGYRSYLEVYGNDHPILSAIVILVLAVMVAGTEELSKFVGYRVVDHPDNMTGAELDEAMGFMDSEDDDRPSFENQDNQTHLSRAAKITVGVVTSAAGFACAENLVYVFIYSGSSSSSTQASILLIRSMFPIHPIAAAIQSIGIVQRDVLERQDDDQKQRTQLGRIILPSMIFHGLFDFVVLLLSYIGRRSGKSALEDDSVNFYTEDGSDKVATIASAFVLVGGLCYYAQQARVQRRKLKMMDGSPITEDDFTSSIERPLVIV